MAAATSPAASHLLDVVHQAEQPPLRAHFGCATQCEAIQTLVVPDVAEHGLDGGNALAVQPPAVHAVYGLAHAVDGVLRIIGLPVVHGDFALQRLRVAYAFRPVGAVLAVAGPLNRA